MKVQIKNSFDAVTLQKLARSFGFALLSGVSAGLTCYTQTENLKLSVLTGVSGLISFVLNVPIEYHKGVSKDG